MLPRPKLISTSLIIALNLLPVSTAAQSHYFVSDQFRQDREARVSLKIPFGTERKDIKAMPKLALSLRQYQATSNFDNSWALKPDNRLAKFGFIENELALSLSQTPQLALNGQPIYISDPENANLSKGAKVGLGLGAIAVVTAGIIVLLIVACQGDGEDPKDGCS